MQYFKVRNWDKFQHYKDRNPPWIKLHNSLLDDPDFDELKDSERYHLLAIWMLASRTNNRMKLDEKWVANKISATSKVYFENLLKYRFIELIQELPSMEQSASNPLVSEETEKRRDREEKDIRPPNGEPLPAKVKIPYEKIKDLYHEILPELPEVKVMTDKRKTQIRQRWNDGHLPDLETWSEYFNFVRKSDFLMGKSYQQGDRKPFVANLEWLTKQANYVKVFERNYHE
jgi:hypothetical protein